MRSWPAYCPLDASCSALESGAGTGQATEPILRTGCALTAVEPGDRLAAILREKYRRYPNLTVLNATFEAADVPEGGFDLVYAAASFHWIEESAGYTKAFRLLKPGGAFARFACHSTYRIPGQERLHEEIQQVYRTWMNYSAESPAYTAQHAAARAEIAGRYGFTDLTWRVWEGQRTYTAAEYIRLIATNSDHIILPEAARGPFYGGIREAIERHGGTITLHDLYDLNMARKPQRG